MAQLLEGPSIVSTHESGISYTRKDQHYRENPALLELTNIDKHLRIPASSLMIKSIENSIPRLETFLSQLKLHTEKSPRIDIPNKDKKKSARLIIDEINETFIELEFNKPVPCVAKELADIWYTIIGAVNTYGLHNRIINEFYPIIIHNIFPRKKFLSNEQLVLRHKTNMEKRFKSLKRVIYERRNVKKLNLKLAEMLASTWNLIEDYGLAEKFDQIFQIVADDNMNKTSVDNTGKAVKGSDYVKGNAEVLIAEVLGIKDFENPYNKQ
ncbi:MAG: hypothetical protein WCJ19_02885 [bacterium]